MGERGRIPEAAMLAAVLAAGAVAPAEAAAGERDRGEKIEFTEIKDVEKTVDEMESELKAYEKKREMLARLGPIYEIKPYVGDGFTVANILKDIRWVQQRGYLDDHKSMEGLLVRAEGRKGKADFAIGPYDCSAEIIQITERVEGAQNPKSTEASVLTVDCHTAQVHDEFHLVQVLQPHAQNARDVEAIANNREAFNKLQALLFTADGIQFDTATLGLTELDQLRKDKEALALSMLAEQAYTLVLGSDSTLEEFEGTRKSIEFYKDKWKEAGVIKEDSERP